MLQGRGFRRVAVAQETRLAVRSLEFKGKDWQNVRTALNRAEKPASRGVGTLRRFVPSLRAQLREVSEEWAAQKSVPEMGFTLGGVDELETGGALRRRRRRRGQTRASPAGCRCTGRAPRELDTGLHAPRGDAFPGVMEFLIASAVQELRSTVEVISLSGSPLAKDTAKVADVAGGRPDPRAGGNPRRRRKST